MADFLDDKRREIEGRLKELKPVVEEYARLEAAVAALDGVRTSAATSAPARRGSRHASPAKPRQRGATEGKRRGRPKGSGTRGAEALTHIKAGPGITIPELAEKMGIKQNYLYRVLPSLAEQGLVAKDGRGWHPKEAA